MQAALNQQLVTVEEYLAAEEASEVKHDYIDGTLYAMAGGTLVHNQIAGNIYAALRAHLQGGSGRVFMADAKVRLQIAGEDIFYYPDVMVACDPRDTHRFYLCFPKVLVEVLSEATERLDRREKRWSYQTIETLEEYLLAAQDRIEVTLFRRTNQWQPEVFNRFDQSIQLASIALALPLSAVYQGLNIAA